MYLPSSSSSSCLPVIIVDLLCSQRRLSALSRKQAKKEEEEGYNRKVLQYYSWESFLKSLGYRTCCRRQMKGTICVLGNGKTKLIVLCFQMPTSSPCPYSRSDIFKKSMHFSQMTSLVL